MTVQEIRDHYERHGLRALSASQVEWLLDAAGGTAGTGAAPPDAIARIIESVRIARSNVMADLVALDAGIGTSKGMRPDIMVLFHALDRAIDALRRGGAAQPPPSAPSLPDTFVERAIRTALVAYRPRRIGFGDGRRRNRVPLSVFLLDVA